MPGFGRQNDRRLVLFLVLVLFSACSIEAAVSAPVPASGTTKEMGTLEKGFWTMLKSFGPSAGSIIGGSIGTAVGPAVITAIVGALGISTAGTGFVAAVVIPASPVIGEIAGSAIGAGVVSFAINIAHGARMQKFRNPKLSFRGIVSGALTQAATDGLIAGGTSYFGAAKGVGQAGKTAAGSLKDLILQTGKRGAVNFAGNLVTGGLTSRATRDLPQYLPEPDDSYVDENPDDSSLAPVEPSENRNSVGGEGDDVVPESPAESPIGSVFPQFNEPEEPSAEVTRHVEDAAYAGFLIGGLTEISRSLAIDQAQGSLIGFVVALNLWHSVTGKAPSLPGSGN